MMVDRTETSDLYQSIRAYMYQYVLCPVTLYHRLDGLSAFPMVMPPTEGDLF